MEYCGLWELSRLSIRDRLRLRLWLLAAAAHITDGAHAEGEATVVWGSAASVNDRAARLLDTYGGSILRCAYSYVHNFSDAEEILQDTLIQYLRTAPAIQSTAHEKAWLLRVASNLSKNQLRYNRLRETDQLQESLEAMEREDLSFVWEAVKQLPDKQREVIHLFYYEGYPTAQITGLLDRRETTVRSDLHRGREKLRQILKEEYDFE